MIKVYNKFKIALSCEGTMKRFIIICIVVFGVVVGGFNIYLNEFVHRNYVQLIINNEDIITTAWVEGDKIYQVNDNQELEEVFIKGVNIGLGKPNSFPGEVSITQSEYLNWFQNIHDLGANFIRVYTLQSPDFYQALFDFNMLSDKPLYLIQGAYMNEDYINEYNDVFNPKIEEDFKTEIKNVIDAVHGNANIDKRVGHAYGRYTSDVSKYTSMMILGIEFSGDTVTNTNLKNPNKIKYDGNYLHTENATPFEVFLAQHGDYAITYETTTYNKQTIIGFANWPTSDPLEHPNEPEDMNKMMGFNVEHIIKNDSYICGMVASYHVYPYYPDFMNFENQATYLSSSPTNPYQDYLKRLNNIHAIPVLISEYGVPTSRGTTHIDLTRGYNQGGLSEQAQGDAIISLTKDIQDAGMCGAIIFSWQDEWFKRTWNTMELTEPDGRPNWHDVQTSETSFGLTAFDPKKDELISTHLSKNDINLTIESDAEYLTIEIKKDNLDIEKDQFDIFFDTTNSSGFTSLNQFEFTQPFDFYLKVDGKKNTELFVDPYYDNFSYLFGTQLNLSLPLLKETSYSSRELNSIRLRLRNRIYIPSSDTTLEPSYYTTGNFLYGPIDTKDENYNSLNDFYTDGDTLTIQIPWLLLNFSDPSQGMILDDFYENYSPYEAGMQMKSKKIDSFTIGIRNNDQIDYLEVPLKNWDEVEYTERLKSSYYIVKDVWSNE